VNGQPFNLIAVLKRHLALAKEVASAKQVAEAREVLASTDELLSAAQNAVLLYEAGCDMDSAITAIEVAIARCGGAA